MERQPIFPDRQLAPRPSCNKTHPIEPGSKIRSTRVRLVTFVPATPKGGEAPLVPKKRKVFVKLEGNRRKAPRRGVYISPRVGDARGIALRMALKVQAMIKDGLIEPEPRVPKLRPPVSKRQMRAEFIQDSVRDANDVARRRRELRTAKQGVRA